MESNQNAGSILQINAMENTGNVTCSTTTDVQTTYNYDFTNERLENYITYKPLKPRERRNSVDRRQNTQPWDGIERRSGNDQQFPVIQTMK